MCRTFEQIWGCSEMSQISNIYRLIGSFISMTSKIKKMLCTWQILLLNFHFIIFLLNIFFQLHHHRELPPEAKHLLGKVPDEFADYWLSRFPKLLLHSWYSMQMIKKEPVFKSYFHPDYDFLVVSYYTHQSKTHNSSTTLMHIVETSFLEFVSKRLISYK